MLFSDLFASVPLPFLVALSFTLVRPYLEGGGCILDLAKCSEQNTRSNQHNIFLCWGGGVDEYKCKSVKV